jgi:DNA-binding transcriptional LysR family regulator
MITLGSTQSIINAVSEGLGISWVSEHAIQDALKLNKIEQADAPYDIERNFYLITRKKRAMNPLSEHFIQFIEAVDLKSNLTSKT